VSRPSATSFGRIAQKLADTRAKPGRDGGGLAMLRYTLRRLLLGIVTLIGVSIIIFVASRLSGDVTYLLLPQDATQQQVEELRHQLGLDQPIYVQYLKFAEGVARGDFGESIRYRQPAMGLMLSRLPATLELAFAAFFVSLVIGLLFGIIAARARGTWLDRVIRTVAIIFQATPPFWIGIMAILVFAVQLHWLPTSGRSGFASLIMPALTLALFFFAALMRITRSAMIENINSEFVKFLRVKGASVRAIVYKHAFRNSMVSVIAFAGLLLVNLIGGTVIVETVFAWPGMGSLIVEAVNNRDYPLIQAGVFIIAVFLICLNIVVDLSFGVIDPRVRYE
jgi:peptide/nickel transport system permease protein